MWAVDPPDREMPFSAVKCRSLPFALYFAVDECFLLFFQCALTESSLLRAFHLKALEILMPANRNEDWIELARARMTAKGKEKPSTKAGAVRALWPVIQIALENGQTLKSIRDWLEDEGIHLSYNQLTSYVGRVRRKMERPETAAPKAGKTASVATEVDDGARPKTADSQSKPHGSVLLNSDPLANVRAREQNRPTFEYNPEFKEDELI